MKIKLLIALVVMCLCLVSCDLGDLGGMLGSGSSSNDNGTESSITGIGSWNGEIGGTIPGGGVEDSDVQSGETEDSNVQSGETEDSDVQSGEDEDSDVQSGEAEDSDVQSGETEDTTDSSTDASTGDGNDTTESGVPGDNPGDKEETEDNASLSLEELETVIYNAKVDEDTKAELLEEIEKLKSNIEKIEKDDSLTEDEKAAAREDCLHNLQDKLQDVSEKGDKSLKEIAKLLKRSDNELIHKLGKALLSKDEDTVRDALEEIADEIEHIRCDKENLEEKLDNTQEEIDHTFEKIEKILDEMDKIDADNNLTEEEKYDALDQLVDQKEQIENERDDLEVQKSYLENEFHELCDSAYDIASDIFDAVKDATDADIAYAIQGFAESLVELLDDAYLDIEDLIKDVEKALKKDKVGKEVAQAIDKIRKEIAKSLAGKDAKDILEDLKDIIENSSASLEDKAAMIDWLDEVRVEIFQNIIENEALSEEEKRAALFTKLREIVDELYEEVLSYAVKYEAQIKAFIEGNDAFFANIGKALLEEDIDALEKAIDEIKQINEFVTDAQWADIIGYMEDALNDIVDNEAISEKIKNIIEKYRGKIENALDKYEIDSIEAAKNVVAIAIDELAEHLKEFMREHFGKIAELKEMIKLLEIKLGISEGSDEENEEEPPVGGEDEKQDQGEQESGKPEEETITIPGFGSVSADVLNDEESLKTEVENQLGRPLTEEELKIIQSYLENLLGWNKPEDIVKPEDILKPEDTVKPDEPKDEPSDELEEPAIKEEPTPSEPTETVFIPGIGYISIDALYDEEMLNKEFDKMFGRPITEEEREIIAAYLTFIKQNK